MTYAVVQRSLKAPTTVQLQAAFAATPGIATSDALMTSRRGFGILIDRVPDEAVAAGLQQALEKQGISAATIEEGDLLDLPTPKQLRQLQFDEQNLTLFDALGRPQPYPWSEVALVAVGALPMTENLRETELQLHHAGGVMFSHVDVKHSQKVQTTPTLVVLAGSQLQGYQVVEDRFNYSCLGSAMTRDRRTNFLLLADTLIKRASNALLNQGAIAFARDHKELMLFHSRRSFLREISWLLWWAQHGHE